MCIHTVTHSRAFTHTHSQACPHSPNTHPHAHKPAYPYHTHPCTQKCALTYIYTFTNVHTHTQLMRVDLKNVLKKGEKKAH